MEKPFFKKPMKLQRPDSALAVTDLLGPAANLVEPPLTERNPTKSEKQQMLKSKHIRGTPNKT